MQLLLTLAVSLLPLALGAPAAEEALDKRTAGNIYMCTGEGWSGTCHNVFFPVGGPCKQVPDEFLYNIGSAGPDAGALCTFFDQHHGPNSHGVCTGTGLAILQRPGSPNLYHKTDNPGGNVKYVQCVQCVQCTNCH